MKKEISNIEEFKDYIHENISIKNFVLEQGFFQKSEFNGDFVRCPFHEGDNTPSLQIKDEFFKCYACGVKGDLISFVELHYNIDFIDAVTKIAEILDINIVDFKMRFNSKNDKLQNEWQSYLDNMESADNKIKNLRKYYFPEEIGYDNKIDYVVLAIRSKTGAILGFTKRRIDFLHKEKGLFTYKNGVESDETLKFNMPKWRHSSLKDSFIDQCANMFNYDVANQRLNKMKVRSIIITEGPKDVIAYKRIELDNVVCSCGTENSNNVWKLLLPLDEIVLSLDGDYAGIKSTLNTIDYLSTFFDIKNVYVVELPDGEDPYSVPKNDLRRFYGTKINAIDFYLKHASTNRIVELYRNTLEYNKVFFFTKLSKSKGFNASETQNFLDRNGTSKRHDVTQSEKSEKERLLDFVNGNIEYFDTNGMDINKAKRILKLKYGIDA